MNRSRNKLIHVFERRERLENLGVDERILLKWTLKETEWYGVIKFM